MSLLITYLSDIGYLFSTIKTLGAPHTPPFPFWSYPSIDNNKLTVGLLLSVSLLVLYIC